MTGIWWVFASFGGIFFVVCWFRFLARGEEALRVLAGSLVLTTSGGIALSAAVAGWLLEAADVPGWMVSPESLRVHLIRSMVGLVLLPAGYLSERFWTRREREIDEARRAERRAAWAPPPAPADNSAAERAEAGRFSPEAEKRLRAGDWYPGLRTDFQLDEFEFELHERAREFVREFSRVDFGPEMWVDPKLANREYGNFAAVAKAGLRNCVPVCGAYLCGFGSIWMDEDGAMYLGGDAEFLLIGRTTDEALECVLLGTKWPEGKWMVEWVES